MLHLALDVLGGLVQQRHADAEERNVIFLPFKEAVFGKGFMNLFWRNRP